METKQSLSVEVKEAKCLHHWVVEPQRGPVSRGVCRRCGVKREFKNYLESYERWDRSGLNLKELEELKVSPGKGE